MAPRAFLFSLMHSRCCRQWPTEGATRGLPPFDCSAVQWESRSAGTTTAATQKTRSATTRKASTTGCRLTGRRAAAGLHRECVRVCEARWLNVRTLSHSRGGQWWDESEAIETEMAVRAEVAAAAATSAAAVAAAPTMAQAPGHGREQFWQWWRVLSARLPASLAHSFVRSFATNSCTGSYLTPSPISTHPLRRRRRRLWPEWRPTAGRRSPWVSMAMLSLYAYLWICLPFCLAVYLSFVCVSSHRQQWRLCGWGVCLCMKNLWA